ncbi:ABC transporter substrate-binding protein, partial [Rhizobiaceae sp. 2RAB30]
TMLDPKLNARSRTLYEPIAAVVANDDKTVTFKLREPYAPLFSYLDLGIVPEAIVKDNAEFGSKPVGSGPFKLASWARGSKITLVSNPDYWNGEPAYKQLEFIIVPDNTARAQALEAGDVQLIYSPLSPADIKRLDANKALTHVTTPSVTYTYVNFNTKDPLLAEVPVRRA